MEKEYKIEFAERGMSGTFSFIGTITEFRVTHPDAEIKSKDPAPKWDKDLKKYV